MLFEKLIRWFKKIDDEIITKKQAKDLVLVEEEKEWYSLVTELTSKKLVREDIMFRNLFTMVCYMLADVPNELFEPMGITPPVKKEVKKWQDKVDNCLMLARWMFITTKEEVAK